jgi:membrane-associated protease RseP (regulator of RpoE activity)
LVIVFALASVISLQAQQFVAEPTYLDPVEMKGQTLINFQHSGDGSIGMSARATDAGFEIISVMPKSPAEGAGLLPGDIIVSMDGASVKGLTPYEAIKPISQKKDGETITLAINRNGEPRTIRVAVGVREHLLASDSTGQKESPFAPSLVESIFDGHARLSVGMFQNEQYFPHHAFVFVNVYNHDTDPFIADDVKFFVVDGTGQQLRHVALDEIKYSIQLSVARNWRGGNYAPPLLPSRHEYTISGVQSGHYTVAASGGGVVAITGTSSSTYTVKEKPDYVALGVSILSAIQQYRDATSNQKALDQGNATIASWEKTYFKHESPVVPGELRGGDIMYWTGSDRKPEPPFRVIVCLTNPRTQNEEYFTFAFGPGAERIKQDMVNQSKTQRALSNGDVINMIKAGIGAETVIAEIKTARCSFETSPSALIELKGAGLPDSVILAMVQAPKN